MIDFDAIIATMLIFQPPSLNNNYSIEMESETQNTQTVIGIIELGGTINSISQHSADEFYDGPNASINSLVEELSIQDNIKLVVEHFSQIISHEITPQTD